ncbi:glycoside hydrolase family 2 protein [Bacteroides graminisolvens]|uniref:glycoside hydrolase family 2 protein n=1 Tax=Bacteroides graminisolvens TaxID=477666 RepID=UPI0023F53C80|nr:glycoside hydrolase family 2 TIM barrel-domain containing protein [Bacteroides graminisolvens]MDD3210539.1 glycoside hydrolase family 2 TIM barrel-domain containing protein [Bacteroides graminisolvens]
MKKIVSTLVAVLLITSVWAQNYRPETSVAGFMSLPGSGRNVYNFNPGWRFHKGDVRGAEALNFDDSAWQVVSTPHTVELEPAEASGGRNYQGIAWYRKHFVVPAAMQGQLVTVYFEAIMGKQEIFLNGKLVRKHAGGYLPFSVNLTDYGIKAGDKCVLAVMTDNSNDKNYPPGKPQYTLDFAYHGGIYRDVWLIGKSDVSITDALEANKVAGGGVFVHFDQISEKKAQVFVDTEVKNSGTARRVVTVETTLTDASGKKVKQTLSRVMLNAGESVTVKQKMQVSNPHLWSPDSPYLYRVESRVSEGKLALDGGVTRVGIRKAEFKDKDGFWLNGKPFGQLVGANRHQDFAYVGNALPNSQQWRDTKRLRDAGCRIVRVAHYPQDPSFMDACDELGIFVIVATPGWQYWNKDPEFARLVHENTRMMIRRDRNHASVLMWEPILNETRYPLDFALEALQITKDEYPYPGRPVAAADVHSEGVKEHYDVVYGWPGDDVKGVARQCIFTREFGENVDDWYAHNNNNRASRSWGERPMLVQALSLAKSYDEMYQTNGQFIGGAQWHPFDHQRGYHPDPYWGGIFDAFRQPKYAYYMFRSQTAANLNHPLAESGPMVYIAHEMSQFSDKDVVVFSNCDSVRLSIYDGTRSWTKPVVHAKGHMPNAPVVFENVWDFWEARGYSYVQKNWKKVNLVAEGIRNGEVVCTTKKMPSRRSTKLQLRVDYQNSPLVADGSDFIVVVAEVTDDSGNVRRLAKENVVFTVEGEGEIIGDATIGANPRAVEFGSAPVLIRSTRKAGKIKVKARVQYEGTHAPTPAEIEFESVPSLLPACFTEQTRQTNAASTAKGQSASSENKILSEEEKQKLLIEVERQQTEFGEKHKE